MIHSSSPWYSWRATARSALTHRARTAVVVGSAGAAAVVAFVGLGSANFFSSSSCEPAQSGATGAISVDTGSVACGTGVVTDAAVSPAATPAGVTSDRSADNASSGPAVPVPAVPVATDPAAVIPAPANPDPASVSPGPAIPVPAVPVPAPVVPTPATPAAAKPPAIPSLINPVPAAAKPAAPKPATVNPAPGNYSDITTFGLFDGTSSHTHGDSLGGGRTAITTEALVSYNGLRAFLGLDAVELDAIGQWAFANSLTNNREAYAQDLKGVGLYYSMQGAKVGWIRDDAFDPKLLADIQRTARQGDTSAVMAMVETYGHRGYADYLTRSGLVDTFVNTLKMEPHYGGWMHGRVHGGLPFSNGSGAQVATAHDLNHLTVLSHDQSQPFMNDTFDWPQWPALEMPNADVIDYFQSMTVLGDPRGNALP